MFVINDTRFCCESKEKVLSSNNFRRVWIWNEKTKMKKLINDELESSSSDNETESESDNEPDNESDNDSDNKTNSESDNE